MKNFALNKNKIILLLLIGLMLAPGTFAFAIKVIPFGASTTKPEEIIQNDTARLQNIRGLNMSNTSDQFFTRIDMEVNSLRPKMTTSEQLKLLADYDKARNIFLRERKEATTGPSPKYQDPCDEEVDYGWFINYLSIGIGESSVLNAHNAACYAKFAMYQLWNTENPDTNRPNIQEPTDEMMAGIARDMAAKAVKDADKCLYEFGINPGVCLVQAFSWIGTIVTGIFGSLLWVAGHLLDLSIYLSISGLSGPDGWFNQDMVKAMWVVIRDLANIFFIFILLYIAIGTIFDLSSIGNPQKLVTAVIIAALLVNFSGFFVRVVVDATNIVAYEFYSQISENTGVASGTGAGKINNLGLKLVKKLSLVDYFVDPATGTDADGKPVTTNADGTPMLVKPSIANLTFFAVILQTFGNIIIILCATFVFLVASGLFLVRSVVLLFVYIMSPLAIVAYAIPRVGEGYFKKWKDLLIKQSLTAPGFLIPLYIVYKILGDEGLKGVKDGTAASSIMLTLVVLGLLVMCLKISQELGAVGLEAVTKWSGRINSDLARVGGRMVKSTPRLAARGVNWTGKKVTGGRIDMGASMRKIATNVREGAGKIATKVGQNKTGKWVGEGVKELGKDIKTSATGSAIGKKISGLEKNPYLAAGDILGTGAGYLGTKGFNIFGSSAEQRKEEKKGEKERKDEERKEKLKDIAQELKNAPNAETTRKILNKLESYKDLTDLPDLNSVVTLPHVIPSLSFSELGHLYKSENFNRLSERKIKKEILETYKENAQGYVYMTTGPDANEWESESDDTSTVTPATTTPPAQPPPAPIPATPQTPPSSNYQRSTQGK